MTTSHHGFSSRTVTKSFEHFHHRLVQLGYTEHEATRGATALAAFEAKCIREQAWKIADQIAPKQNRPPE